MSNKFIEITVGLFMLAGFAGLLILAFKISDVSGNIGQSQYTISAQFDDIGSLKSRAPVTIAGVKIGEVSHITLDPMTFKAKVVMSIEHSQRSLPVDTSARILTAGLLGSNYISLTPGYEDTYLKDGSRIDITYSALVLENLIGQFLFSIKGQTKKDSI